MVDSFHFIEMGVFHFLLVINSYVGCVPHRF